jgi:LEA14-like dessication related protein
MFYLQNYYFFSKYYHHHLLNSVKSKIDIYMKTIFPLHFVFLFVTLHTNITNCSNANANNGGN